MQLRLADEWDDKEGRNGDEEGQYGQNEKRLRFLRPMGSQGIHTSYLAPPRHTFFLSGFRTMIKAKTAPSIGRNQINSSQKGTAAPARFRATRTVAHIAGTR